MKLRVLTIICLCFGSSLSWSLTNSVPADAPEFQSIVAIAVDAHDPASGDLSTGYCNATLLNSRLLLTAAHCVGDAQILHSPKINVKVGHYIYVKRKTDGKIVRVGYGTYYTKDTTAQFFFSGALSQKLAQQGFQAKIGPEEDMAAILLSQPMELPTDFPYANVVTQADFSRMTQMNLSGLNVASINIFANMSTSDTMRFATLNSVKWSGNFIESTSSSRLEEGDSGAPIYTKTNAGLIVVGVVKGHGQSIFGEWDAFSPAGSLVCDIAHRVSDQSMAAYLCR